MGNTTMQTLRHFEKIASQGGFPVQKCLKNKLICRTNEIITFVYNI